MNTIQSRPQLWLALWLIAALGFCGEVHAQQKRIVVGSLVGTTPDPEGQTCWYIEDVPAGQVISKQGSVLNVSAEKQHYSFPGDVRCPKSVPLWHGRSGAAGAILLGIDPYRHRKPGVKYHLCEYYLDEYKMAYWRSLHPEAPRPIFEAIVPVTTRCPNPPDDYTPLLTVMPANQYAGRDATFISCHKKKTAALAEIPGGRDRFSAGYAAIESQFESCLAEGGRVLKGTMLDVLKDLPEFTASRKLAPGVEGFGLGGGDSCYQVWVYTPDFGDLLDQYLCVDDSSGTILVGTQYAVPPVREPLNQWRATHRSGFTYHGQPVMLEPDSESPSGNSPSEVQIPIPEADTVVDQINLLNELQRPHLLEEIHKVGEQTAISIAVLIVASTGNESIEAYGQRVVSAWSEAKKWNRDGAVIVIAKNDRKVQIQLTKSLSQRISDASASEIVGVMVPHFKQGDFLAGLEVGIDEISRRGATTSTN